jgi:pilus assembly protein CpaE
MAKTPQDEQGGAETEFGAAAHERPVPRISIHVFNEFPDTAVAVQRAATDRRFSKAHIEIHAGGVPAAVEHFRGQSTPNLLVVETRSQGPAVLDELDSLADVCDEATKVLVIGRSNDVHLYRELMRRGVSEYLVAPLDPLHLIETISGLYTKPDAAPIGRVVAFVGARGGAGSSTVAHNVGWYVAEGLKVSTTIIDFDLPFGTAGLNFNEEAGQGVADALAAPERLDDMLLERLLIKCGEHLSLFAAPALVNRVYDANVAAYETVIDQVRSSAPCVIVDLPHVWTEWSRQTLLAADEIVIVSTLDLASLRNAKSVLDIVRGQRPNDSPPKLALNQVGVPKRPEIPVKEFAAALGIEPSVAIPFDPHLFGTAANNGQMLAEVQADARAAEEIRHLAEVITGRAVQRAAKKSGLSFLPFLSQRKAG